MNKSSRDDEDVRDAERVIAGVRSNEIETHPLDVVKHIIEGRNPARVFRKFQGMTIDQPANGAGVPPADEGQIEAEKRQARAEEMERIVSALNIDADLLVRASE